MFRQRLQKILRARLGMYLLALAVAVSRETIDADPCQAQTRNATQPTHATQPPHAEQPSPARSSPAQRTASSFANVTPRSPVTAFIGLRGAELFSGPSRETYATGQRTRGQSVDVYYRTADGWLGIRPPVGSFSWVKASDAFLLPGGKMIEITGEPAVSWIGSELGSAKSYRWQVQLQRGEQLARLDEAESQDASGKRVLWYKIAPPAGEFRWIEEAAVQLQPPAEPGIARVLPTRHAPRAVDGSPQELSDGPTEVRTASAARGDERVRSANYDPQYDVFEGEMANDGGYIVSDESIVEGDVIYLDEQMLEDTPGGLGWASSNPWDGWHAVELTDEGFRVPFLERRFQQAQAGRHADPRNHDPFSLAMVPKNPVVAGPVTVREQVRADTGIAPEHRYTPWRDPRELREQRLQGYPDQSLGAVNRPPSRLASQTREPEAREREARDLLARLMSAISGPEAATGNRPVGDERSDGPYTGGPAADAGVETANSWTGQRPAVPRQSDPWQGLAESQPAGDFRSAKPSAFGPAVAQHASLQLSLSEMVAQPMERWNFGDLAIAIQELIRTAPTPVERGQARLLLERMESFATVARKSGLDPTAGMGSPAVGLAAGNLGDTVRTAGGSTGGMVATAAYAGAGNNLSSSYDATGWLVPVHAAVAGQPTHALTQDDGSIIAYVSGLPGQNLELYVNQAVGIQGLRGYLPQLQANHIQVQRVVRIKN